MPFTTPLALLGLLFVPAVVAMYLLKLRREETPVPSTLLWHRLVADVEANAPWQRLRRSLLFLLQLLLVIVLVLLAARPFLERPAGLARDIVLVVDTSASMGATDLQPDRLTAAKAAAIDALKDLPTGGKVSVIEAGRTARIVSSGSTDLGRVRLAIDSIRGTSAPGDLGDALALASELAAQSGDAQVLIATDAALASVPKVSVDAPVRVLRVGSDAGTHNQAIVALAVRTAPSAVTRSVFVSIANLDTQYADRRLELWGDGQLLESRDVDVDAQQRADVIIDDVPESVSVVEVRLVNQEQPDEDVAPDELAADDRAWAIVPPDRARNVLLVGEGDPFLETALSYLPNTNLFGVKPDRYPADARRTDGSDWDLIIFEGAVPDTLPDVPTLARRAARDEPARDRPGEAREPRDRVAVAGRADPALRRPDDHPHLRGRPARPPGLGPERDPRTEGRAAPLRRRPGQRPERRSRVRAAPQRPAAAGRVPDPDREPDRRADGRQRRADRGAEARRPGLAAGSPRRDRAARRAAGRLRRGARAGHGGRADGDVHPDGPAGRVHRDAGLPGRGGAQRRRVALGHAATDRGAVRQPRQWRRRGPGRRRRDGPGPVRRRPLRRRRVDDQARQGGRPREAGPRGGRPGRLPCPGRLGRPVAGRRGPAARPRRAVAADRADRPRRCSAPSGRSTTATS